MKLNKIMVVAASLLVAACNLTQSDEQPYQKTVSSSLVGLSENELSQAGWIQAVAYSGETLYGVKEGTYNEMKSYDATFGGESGVFICITGFKDRSKQLMMWSGCSDIKNETPSDVQSQIVVARGPGLRTTDTVSVMKVDTLRKTDTTLVIQTEYKTDTVVVTRTDTINGELVHIYVHDTVTVTKTDTITVRDTTSMTMFGRPGWLPNTYDSIYYKDRYYKTYTVDGLTWMAEDMTWRGLNGSWGITDTVRSPEPGVLYTTTEARYVCPDGWHTMTYGDLAKIPHSSDGSTWFNASYYRVASGTYIINNTIYNTGDGVMLKDRYDDRYYNNEMYVPLRFVKINHWMYPVAGHNVPTSLIVVGSYVIAGAQTFSKYDVTLSFSASEYAMADLSGYRRVRCVKDSVM